MHFGAKTFSRLSIFLNKMNHKVQNVDLVSPLDILQTIVLGPAGKEFTIQIKSNISFIFMNLEKMAVMKVIKN